MKRGCCFILLFAIRPISCYNKNWKNCGKRRCGNDTHCSGRGRGRGAGAASGHLPHSGPKMKKVPCRTGRAGMGLFALGAAGRGVYFASALVKRPVRSRAGRRVRYSTTAHRVDATLFTKVMPPATLAAGKQFVHNRILQDLILMIGHSNQCRQVGGE